MLHNEYHVSCKYFLQETYSTEETENLWKSQWPGEIYFAHGSIHSRGVAILIRKGFDFELKSLRSDEEGRYLILKANIQDVTFLSKYYYKAVLVFPNTVRSHCRRRTKCA